MPVHTLKEKYLKWSLTARKLCQIVGNVLCSSLAHLHSWVLSQVRVCPLARFIGWLIVQCTHFLMNSSVHPCSYTHKHEFSAGFSITCHDFSGSSFKRCVVNIIYAHDSMHRSFCASEDFACAYSLHGSPLNTILVCSDKRGVKQRISVVI